MRVLTVFFMSQEAMAITSGLKDKSIHDKLLNAHQTTHKGVLKSFGIEEDQALELLEDLVSFEFSPDREASGYWYAFYLYCRVFGHHAGQYEVNWQVLDESEVASRLIHFRSADLFPFPRVPEPLVSAVDPKALAVMAAHWKNQDFENESGSLQQMNVDFADWVEEASNRQEWLIVFLTN